MSNPILSKLAGDFDKDPTGVRLSDEALRVLHQAFEDIPIGKCWDYHVHVLGLGTGSTGCWVNPQLHSWLHPVDHVKMHLYISGSGIDDVAKADQQYLNRLLSLARTFPGHGKFCLLAIDKCYDRDGNVSEEDTKFYVPNEYVTELSRAYPDVFVPVVSVHPYRRDALQELDKWGKAGVKMLKWMPSVMGMNAADPVCDAFYDKMKAYGMVLLTHVGKEDAMQVVKFKPLNNPLLFRRPLERGLKVIMAHCAGLGHSFDLEASSPTLVKNYKLFLRLMEEKAYQGLLFGDISGMIQINRCRKPLKTMLLRQDLHHRLVNGSDYPMPALNSTISTEFLVRLGYLPEEARKPLNEIYRMNPLLFDFAVKRLIHAPHEPNIRFPASVFVHNPALGLSENADQKSSAANHSAQSGRARNA